MGLFSRESKEEKAYNSALKSANSKPSEKTFVALEGACQSWPSGWQGRLLMGLSYDCGSGVPCDPGKAQQQHALAKQAGANNEWMAQFYAVYEESGLNYLQGDQLFPRTLAVRKASVACILNLDIQENAIVKGGMFNNDVSFWRNFFGAVDTGGLFKASDVQKQVYDHVQPIKQLLSDWDSYKSEGGKEQQQMVKRGNYVIKQWNGLRKAQMSTNANACDLWGFVLGYSLLTGGAPYYFTPDSEWYRFGLQYSGFSTLWQTALRGSSASVRFLGQLLDDNDLGPVVYRAGADNIHDNRKEAVDVKLLECLQACAEMGDNDALDLGLKMGNVNI